MVVYLSGINHETSKQELNKLKANLLDLGCTIITPDTKELEKLNWSENIRLRLSFLQSSCTIYMLPDWRNSVMARIELTAAMGNRIPLCFSPQDLKDLITTLGS